MSATRTATNREGLRIVVSTRLRWRGFGLTRHVKPRATLGLPFESVLLERRWNTGARVVVVAELEAAPRAYLVGRGAKKVLVRWAKRHLRRWRP